MYEQIPHMKQLYFAGGEATIIEEHYTLLEEVVKRGMLRIELRYNSNGLEMSSVYLTCGNSSSVYVFITQWTV